MYNLRNGTASLCVFILGFTFALLGVAKPEKSFAKGVDGNDPVFGKKNSSVEVYIITDWFCPACVRLTPTLQAMYPKIAARTRLYFIDEVIHPETMNYIPYNLSFMIHDKDKYFAIREALHKLATKTKTPTPQQVQAAVRPLGVTYQQLNYSDIDSGVRFFQGVIKTFNINTTPTVVVSNRKKLKAKRLSGNKITEAHVMHAIEQME